MAGSFTPRAIFIDIDHSLLNQIQSGSMSKLYNTEQFVDDKVLQNGLYGSIFQFLDDEQITGLMDAISKELEMCDQFQGFVFNYSASGGTATSIMAKLEGQIHSMKRPAYSNLILPSAEKMHLSCTPYNFLFSLSNTVDNRNGN